MTPLRGGSCKNYRNFYENKHNELVFKQANLVSEVNN